jgi:hypothetical protein
MNKHTVGQLRHFNSPQWKPKLYRSISMVLMASLAACGGGSENASVSASSAAADNLVVTREAGETADSVRFVEKTSSGFTVSSAKPFSSLEKTILKASTEADLTTIDSAALAQSDGLIQARAAGDNPAACKLYRFTTTPSCWLQASTYYDVGPGTSTADYGPAVSNCIQATVGTSYVGTTPAAGGSTCYQFVINASATVNSQVILPAGITGIVELFSVASNNAGMKIADAQSPSDPLNVNVTSAYHRYAIMVRPGNGPGAQPFSIGVGTTAPPIAPTLPNSDAQHPKVLAMNQTQTDVISATGQKDFYYFYPSTANQTTAEFISNFSSDQTVGYRPAQRSATGVYSFNPETLATSANQSLIIGGVLPNTTGATVVNGVMVRVSAKVPAAPVAGAFSIRAGVKTGYINLGTLWNYEGLTRVYAQASGRQQAYSYIGVSVTVKDVNGAPVAGEQVNIDVYLDENNQSVSISMVGVTDASGIAGFQPSILNNCPSTAVTSSNTSTSSPPENYTMVGSKASVKIRSPNTMPVAPNNNSNIISVPFYKICSETYMGH